MDAFLTDVSRAFDATADPSDARTVCARRRFSSAGPGSNDLLGWMSMLAQATNHSRHLKTQRSSYKGGQFCL